jgi:hypothetical protein
VSKGYLKGMFLQIMLKCLVAEYREKVFFIGDYLIIDDEVVYKRMIKSIDVVEIMNVGEYLCNARYKCKTQNL